MKKSNLFYYLILVIIILSTTIASMNNSELIDNSTYNIDCDVCNNSNTLGCDCEEYEICVDLFSNRSDLNVKEYCIDIPKEYENKNLTPSFEYHSANETLILEEIEVLSIEQDIEEATWTPATYLCGAYAGCWNCNNNNYESNDDYSYCECDEWERCKDPYRKSTAYEYDGYTYATDICKDQFTVYEAIITCYWTDEICYEEISCPTYYECSDGGCVYTGCDYSPACSYSWKRTCYSSISYHKYSASTACSGGCSYSYYASYSCGTGSYCSGTSYDSNYPCYTCSTTCDNSCQSSGCYGTDPDCDSSGGATLACCGNGDCESGETYSNCPSDCSVQPDISVYPTSLTFYR